MPRDLFRFTTTERADLHTAVMEAFGAANERLVTALAFDDIHAALGQLGWLEPVDDDDLARTLQGLVEWRLLDVTQDHAHSYATAEEYERKNLRYALTRAGEAAVAGVEHALAQLEATGALQTAVLEAIADRLAHLARLLDDDGSDDRQLYVVLTELEGHLDALRTNTKQFNNELQRLLRDDAADRKVFHDVKTSTVAYLEEYVTNLDRRARAISEGIARVEGLGLAALHQRALAGADLPTLGGDPAPRWLAQRAARWEGLQRWFRPADGRPPRADDLRAVAQRAIVSLLRVLEQFREQRRRPSNLAADFRTLARWFAACPTADEGHRLWSAAFGLCPSRHAHLVAEDPDDAAATTAWADAPAVPVSPLLRTRGRTEHVARTAAVRDTSELRRRRQAEAARERAEVEAAWQRLVTDGPVRLASLERLDHDTFARLLELVGRALSSAAGRDGRYRAVTADGQLEVVLGPPGQGRRARIATPRGTFEAPDYTLVVRSLLGAAAREEASA